jgi:hypothetical protein
VRRITYACLSPVYHPREPTDSCLYKILHDHYEDFKSGPNEHCMKQYQFSRPVLGEAMEEYLKCGDLHEGFARVRCPQRRVQAQLTVSLS